MTNTQITTRQSRPRNTDIFNKLKKMVEDPKLDFSRELWFNDSWLNDFFPASTMRDKISFPKYNVLRTDNGLKLEIALAGYDKSDLKVEVSPKNVLTVKTNQQSSSENSHTSDAPEIDRNGKEYIHKGIASREFSIGWRLGQHQEVGDVTFVNGMLMIDIINDIPEEPESKVLKIK